MGEKRFQGVKQFLVGGAATSGAALFTNPVEVVKTRMQMEGELVKKTGVERKYKSIPQAFRLIYQHEGLAGIQRGLVPACIYQLFMNGCRLGFYEPIRRSLGGNVDDQSVVGFLRSIAAGATSGAIGAMVGSPFFMVKCRIQIQSVSSALQTGYQHQYRGWMDGCRHVLREEGAAGLFRGASAAVPRVAVGSAAQLSIYHQVKGGICRTGWFSPTSTATHFTSSFLTGFFVVMVMNPFDVVSTRIYNQPLGADGKGQLYTGVVDCFSKIARTEGAGGFFKGWFPHWMRLGPHTILTFVFWERLKAVVDV